MAKKDNSIIRRVEDIDESELLDSIGETSTKEPDVKATPPKKVSPQIDTEVEDEDEEEDIEMGEEPIAPSKETVAIRKQAGDFKSVFLSPRTLKVRQSVYISQEIHGKISKIVNQIADAELTVGTYVDTVLRQHLKKNKNEINALYKKERDDLI